MPEVVGRTQMPLYADGIKCLCTLFTRARVREAHFQVPQLGAQPASIEDLQRHIPSFARESPRVNNDTRMAPNSSILELQAVRHDMAKLAHQ